MAFLPLFLMRSDRWFDVSTTVTSAKEQSELDEPFNLGLNNICPGMLGELRTPSVTPRDDLGVDVLG